jgi:hypothetical protein
MGSYRPALFALLALAACGGSDPLPPSDDDDDDPGPPAPVVAQLAVAGPATVVTAGATLQLTATAKDAAGTVIPNAQISWTTSAINIATVDNNGRVRGEAAGPATITASSGIHSAQWMVNVRDSASLPVMLAGTVHRVHLNIPQGAVHQVNGSLMLLADSSITIAGAIEFAPGATITIAAPTVRFRGTIRRAAGAASPLASRLASPLATPWARALNLARPRAAPPHAAEKSGDTPAGEVVVAGTTLELDGSIGSPGDIFISGIGIGQPGLPATLIMGGELVAADGEDGTLGAPHGGRGSSIYLGSDEAKAKAFAASEELSGSPVPISFFSTRQLPVGVELICIHGGNGGRGFSVSRRADGVSANNVFDAFAGDGGAGGTVYVNVGTPADVGAASGALVPGNGGHGGSVVLVGAEKLRDGSGLQKEGESLTARVGAGGREGEAFLKTTNPPSTQGFFGQFGDDGGLRVSGGNGIDGGRGGNLEVRLQSLDVVSNARVEIESAANGGASNSASKDGGDAGDIRVTAIDTDDRAIVEKIVLDNSGSGGAGFNGCVQPLGPGTDGGTASVINFKGLTPELTRVSLVGGSGGNGFGSPGRGGGRAEDLHTGMELGAEGEPGGDCTGAFITVSTNSVAIQFSPGLPPCVPPPVNQFLPKFTIVNQTSGPVLIEVNVLTIQNISGLSLVSSDGNLVNTTQVAVAGNSSTDVRHYLNPCVASSTAVAEFQLRVVGATAPFKIIPVTICQLGSCMTELDGALGIDAPVAQQQREASESGQTRVSSASHLPYATIWPTRSAWLLRCREFESPCPHYLHGARSYVSRWNPSLLAAAASFESRVTNGSASGVPSAARTAAAR